MLEARQASFSRVYASTRLQLGNAELIPGTQLLVNEQAALHGVSATPVREAFAKLAGERLIEDRERLGYFVPLLSSVELISLTELLELYLMQAISHGRRRDRTDPNCGAREMRDEAAAMMAIFACSDNPLLGEEAQRCLDRSAFARRRQIELYGPPATLGSIAEALALRDWSEVSRHVRLHCRTSRARAGEVAHSMAATYRETIARK